ncbi:adenylate/guanylate cyclase domain-containing protein [Mucilaginibacter jinjuensis]|uniref:Adenylate/guanylate cyclase domain-containing protein n=1 Tax=Mucilaginibacter jinjuensis TaxID=1176721 RepID=A0ABY7T6Z6_9SPHI|nr:adenylate/guanylate cyclase domain-containing protein [Mucilaginibacter jinjuensis]WCT11601.1 adenylate/guanylate cyclase domain-containing protein [Mucilaginibacter jinjuensis]
MKICTPAYKNINTLARFAPSTESNPNPCIKMADNNILCRDHSNNRSVPHTSLGIEKELGLLFLDIRNFTAFMESRSAYDVIYVIRQLFVLFSDSIKEAGGRIIETAGDSIYAVFGLESSIKKAVQSAVDASSAIFHDLEIFNATYAQPYFNLNFEIGVGLHKGNVIVGEYDMEFNEHTTVMGLPVNIASRLQSETKELNNNMLISEEAYSLLNNQSDEHQQKTVHLKGVTEPVDVRLMGIPYGHKVTNKPSLPDNFDYYIAMAG